MARHQKHTSIINNVQRTGYANARSTVNRAITSVDLNHSIVYHSCKSAHGRLNANASAGLTSSTVLRLFNDGSTESVTNDGETQTFIVEYKSG